MKTVIFAGGLGTRLSEETSKRPKPMVEIGGKPILWHIIKIYESFGFSDFIICLGYKGYMIKEYFMNYYLHNSDISIDLKSNEIKIHKNKSEDIKISLIETGLNTLTAGRLERVKDHIGNEDFMLTYGDGVANVNLKELLSFHKEHNKIATMTVVQPPGRFGSLKIGSQNSIADFVEKPLGDGGWINGGFFVLKPAVFDVLGENSDNTMWEQGPLQRLSSEGNLKAYKHTGFWKCMDHLRDKVTLDEIWNSGAPPWKNW